MHQDNAVQGEAMMSVKSQRAPRPAPAPQVSSQPQVIRMLAYRYSFGFSIPAKNLESVSAQVVDDCTQAGMDNCQIVTSSVNRYAEDQVSASISLRVLPDWFVSYRQKLTTSSQAAGGKMTSSNVSSEDLTLAISDNDAKLAALRTLRTRLQGLLETKGSTVKDLMAVERELARVQGQIESSMARLRILRTRVRMSEVNLDYQSKAEVASPSAIRPVLRALTNFLGTASEGLAGVIGFVAFTLPWMIIVVPVFWYLRRVWSRRRMSKKSKS